MKKRFEDMISLFMRITTGVLFVAAAYITVFYGWEVELGVEILWQILIVSALCTLGSIILPMEGEKEVSKCSLLVYMILYYLYNNAAVLFCGVRFEWFSFRDRGQVLGMLAAIAFVFVVVAAITYWVQYQVAKKMNQKLKERE